MAVLLVVAMAGLALLSMLVPMPTAVSALGLALIVPFLWAHCAKPALLDSGAPRLTASVVRGSAAVCILASCLYALFALVVAITDTGSFDGAFQPLKIVAAIAVVPVLAAFLFPAGVIVLTRGSRFRRG